VSILEVGDGVFEVKSTSGDTLGGNDFDKKIVDWLAEQFLETEEVDLSAIAKLYNVSWKPLKKLKLSLASVSGHQLTLYHCNR